MMTNENYRQQLFITMAQEIADIRQLLQNLEELLMTDEDVIMKHYKDLQQFDLIIQHVDESAKLLERLADGTCSDEAIASVRLGRLRGRLQSAVSAAIRP
ncbi:hypothetical protein [Sphingobium sp. B2]|uniref:hypothetical protein n=1 Tax=Sphingobium sp. B2 TaxID=2583228 RepID=UPI0011A471B4|nr:hypothetical protein [Sphingobium sp. B2]